MTGIGVLWLKGFVRLANRLIKGWKSYLLVIAGLMMAAVSINIFLVPYKISPGGVSGIATVIFYLSEGRFPVWISVLALNIPLFLVGLKFIGVRFALSTLASIFLFSFFLNITQTFSNSFVENYLVKVEQSPVSPDLLLYSVFGGLFSGAGLGMVFRAGTTTGGTDIAAKIIHRFKPDFSIGQILLFIETSIVVFAAVSFRSFLLALYAIVTLYVQSKVMDALLEGVNFAKAVFIISNKSDDIAKKVLTELDRGLTALHGTGMYTGASKDVLLCVLPRQQIPKLKDIVKKIDDKAFVILTDIREVLGEGFKVHD